MAKDHPTGQSGLYQAFLQLKTPEQCYRCLQDVCSYSELSAMEQRYNIAEMLVDKRIYTEIMDKTGASSAIISRVSRVLSAADSVLRGRQNQKMRSCAACRPERHAAFLSSDREAAGSHRAGILRCLSPEKAFTGGIFYE